jgi:hypothetical protein
MECGDKCPYVHGDEIKQRVKELLGMRTGAIALVAAKLNCLNDCKVKLSEFNSSRRAVGMW